MRKKGKYKIFGLVPGTSRYENDLSMTPNPPGTERFLLVSNSPTGDEDPTLTRFVSEGNT